MAYKIENNRLFVKITQTSPIWEAPKEIWMEIGLPDLPENVGGIIEFRPLPVATDEIESQLGEQEPQESGLIGKPTGPPELVGEGKTIRGDDFKIFKCSPTKSRDYPFYLMESASGVKYYSPTFVIAKMNEVFRIHADRKYKTLEGMKKDLLNKTQNTDFKNPHNFCVFFNLLQLSNEVSLEKNDDESSTRKYNIIVRK